MCGEGYAGLFTLLTGPGKNKVAPQLGGQWDRTGMHRCFYILVTGQRGPGGVALWTSDPSSNVAGTQASRARVLG